MSRAIGFGAVCWTASVLFFVGQAVAGAVAHPYSPVTNLISDLGDTACGPDLCSPLAGPVNATFVVAGILHALGAIATWQAWPRRPQGGLAAIALATAGLGLVVAGLAPENVAPTAHALGALVGLVSLNAGMILLAASIWPASRWLSILCRAAGVVGLIGFGFFLSGWSALPAGLVERLADYPATIMIVVLGVVLLGSAATGRRLSARQA